MIVYLDKLEWKEIKKFFSLFEVKREMERSVLSFLPKYKESIEKTNKEFDEFVQYLISNQKAANICDRCTLIKVEVNANE